ncbi:MAG TPA: hypothetical protein VLB44_26030 [Kofleriaceae bacterium]|nr:hypothetical protein [Kofleriaceae bacterium]
MKHFALLLAFSAACGSDSPAADGNNIDPSMRYEPWSIGAVWEYKLVDPANPAIMALNKKTTMMAEQDVGGPLAGTMAYLAHIEKLNGSKDVWETFKGDLDIRYKTIQYDSTGTATETDYDQPWRLKLDESAAHTVTGAQWSESFTEITQIGTTSTPKSKTEQWRVVNAAEQLTVIAGSYTTLHVQRTDTGGMIQDYWYARGVGKVKETGGAGQNEELMSYTPGQ